MSDDSDYQEFEADSGEYWFTAAWSRLRDTFSLTSADLPEWHKVMSGQGRAGEILRLVFQVASVIRPSEESNDSWTVAEVAQRMGLSEATVEEEIAGAVMHWNQRHSEALASNAAITDEEYHRLTNFTSGLSQDKEKVDGLLTAHGFAHIADPTFRAEMALRIISLRDFLLSSHQKARASEILRLEASIHATKQLLLHNQNMIARLIEEDKSKGTTMRTPEIERYQGKAEDLEDRITKMNEAHGKACAAIGANEIDKTARKRVFIDTVLHLVEMSRIHYSDADNWLADGTWTAAEIAWQMDPLGERGSQYRLDIALRNSEAMAPENFWNPNYVPTKIPRRVCERLARMMKELAPLGGEADDEFADISEDDDDDDDDEDEGSDAATDETDSTVLSAVDAGDTSRHAQSFAPVRESAPIRIF